MSYLAHIFDTYMPQKPISMAPYTLVHHDAEIRKKEINVRGQPNLKIAHPRFSCDNEHMKAPTLVAR
jgi:hypothetical protein